MRLSLLFLIVLPAFVHGFHGVDLDCLDYCFRGQDIETDEWIPPLLRPTQMCCNCDCVDACSRQMGNNALNPTFSGCYPPQQCFLGEWLRDINGTRKVLDEARDIFLGEYRPNQYRGCFIDTGIRDMPDRVILLHHTNSPSACIAECEKEGFQYAGLQYSYECWCSNSYGRWGRDALLDLDKCNMGCPLLTRYGTVRQDVLSPESSCGGVWANSVWATKYADDFVQIQASTTGEGVSEIRVECSGNLTAAWPGGEPYTPSPSPGRLDIRQKSHPNFHQIYYEIYAFGNYIGKVTTDPLSFAGPSYGNIDAEEFEYPKKGGDWATELGGACDDVHGNISPGEGENPPSLFVD